MPAPASSNFIGIHTAQQLSSTSARPLTGVFETLAEQHRQVLDLLQCVASSRVASKRRELWTEARRRMLSHERAEERAVYATLESFDAAQALLEQHAYQAAELELAIADLDATDDESDEWGERLRDVRTIVEDHVRDEEHDFFPRAQELLGENAARELEDPFASAQRDVRDTLA